MLELTLPIEWGFSESCENIFSETPLGDNYISNVTFGTSNQRRILKVTSTLLNELEKNEHLLKLTFFAGSEPFLFREKIYRCEKWTVKRYRSSFKSQNEGLYEESSLIEDPRGGLYQISGELIEYSLGECVTALEEISKVDILNYLSGSLSFIQTYKRDTAPFLVNSDNGIKDTFHPELGRGGYYPSVNSGTSETHFIAIKACCEAYLATGNLVWKTSAENFANYLITYAYNGVQPPTNPNTLYIPHWLFNVGSTFPAKEPVSTDPENSGVYDLVVSFTNGVGQIPSGSPNFGERLSECIVYDGNLIWKNLYSNVVGTKYSINYWVSNIQGSINRVTPGRVYTSTTETPGRIVLNSNYTGNLKVAFARWSTTATVIKNQRYDAYPIWRNLNTGERTVVLKSLFLADSAFKSLFDITNDQKWYRAYLANQYTILQASNISQIIKWYEKSNNPEPLNYPGSQVVQSNNPNPFTVTRMTSGTFLNFIRINVLANPGNFPSIEFQNFASKATVALDYLIYVEVGMSITGILQVILSLSENPLDFSKQYIYNLFVDTSNTIKSFNINPGDFIKWSSNNITWFPNCVANPIYINSTGDSSAIVSNEHVAITATTFPLVHKITFYQFAGGTVRAGLNFLSKVSPQPPRMFYKVTGANIILRIKDGTNRNYDCVLQPNSNWIDRTFYWEDFTFSTQNSLSNIPPSGNLNITAIEFVATVVGVVSSISIYWVTIGGSPAVLEDYSITYKGIIKDSINLSHSLYIGDFYPAPQN